MERRRCTTVRQLELMVQFLEHRKDLALGRVRSREAREVAARLWRECAETLNAEGPTRTAKEWAKVWNDYKCRVRSKLISINANQRATGGGSSNPILSPLEERIANVIGREVDPLADVRQDQIFTTNDDDGMLVVLEVVDTQPQNLQESGASSPLIPNINNADQSTYMVSETSPVEVPTSPVPSLLGQAPSLHNTARGTSESVRQRRVCEPRRQSRRMQRASRHLTTQCSRIALQESRQMILRIEEIRAQAALKYADAFCNFSDSFKLIAQSINRCCQQYCVQQSPPKREETNEEEED